MIADARDLADVLAGCAQQHAEASVRALEGEYETLESESDARAGKDHAQAALFLAQAIATLERADGKR